MDSLLPFFLLAMSLIFAWQAYRGFSRGITRFPMMLIGDEEFERGHTMFWGVVGANIAAGIALLGVASAAFLKGW